MQFLFFCPMPTPVIDIFICGGTIDKTYFPEREVFDFEKTHINELIANARISSTVNLNVRFLFMRDSLDMETPDRARIARACRESLSHHIMIMHGTSTMIQTAKEINAQFTGGKTIVLFGALLPYELTKSDALFSFGAALSAVQLLEPGVYITMNGRVWPHDQVAKDEKAAMFVDVG